MKEPVGNGANKLGVLCSIKGNLNILLEHQAVGAERDSRAYHIYIIPLMRELGCCSTYYIRYLLRIGSSARGILFKLREFRA